MGAWNDDKKKLIEEAAEKRAAEKMNVTEGAVTPEEAPDAPELPVDDENPAQGILGASEDE